MVWKAFIASCLVFLLVSGFLALQSLAESIPFTDSWAYYRNYHPIRYTILTALKWASLGLCLLFGLSLIVKKLIKRVP